jgi:carbon-monoxide dehydrogenase medium subunit
MYNFEYQKATDAQTAVTALKTHPDAKYLGGGQSLLAAMKLRSRPRWSTSRAFRG